MASNEETTPLLRDGDFEATKLTSKKPFIAPTTLILFAGFIISLSFSYTQTPYVFRCFFPAFFSFGLEN